LSLNLASNDIGNFSGTGQSKIALDALGEALKGTILTELNMSANKIKGKDIQGLANNIKDMGALSSLNLANNMLGWLSCPEGWETTEGSDKKQYFKSATQSWTTDPPPGAKPEGVIALANAIPDMRAILSVNLLKNRIGSDQAEALVSMLKEHPNLKSLCGNRGDETELDMSGKMDGAGDAVMLAAEVIDNGAMTSLDLSSNGIGAEGGAHIAEAIKVGAEAIKVLLSIQTLTCVCCYHRIWGH
jgi:Ran GTPase-activating protein (RanGAP) involved in mRNA processing and transport